MLWLSLNDLISLIWRDQNHDDMWCSLSDLQILTERRKKKSSWGGKSWFWNGAVLNSTLFDSFINTHFADFWYSLSFLWVETKTHNFICYCSYNSLFYIFTCALNIKIGMVLWLVCYYILDLILFLYKCILSPCSIYTKEMKDFSVFLFFLQSTLYWTNIIRLYLYMYLKYIVNNNNIIVKSMSFCLS